MSSNRMARAAGAPITHVASTPRGSFSPLNARLTTLYL
jgi:hypothetical protein